jgi:Ser-tRNA(Ala) deacylase AlaX
MLIYLNLAIIIFLITLSNFSHLKASDVLPIEPTPICADVPGTIEQNTNLLYLKDTYHQNAEALILEIGADKKGAFLILDQTIFYPQGGGQETDIGIIRANDCEYMIHHVGFHAGKALHYTKNPLNELVPGMNVSLFLDLNRRLQNAASHTGGHLVDACVGMMNPLLVAKGGNHFSKGAYIEFENEIETLGICPDIFLAELNARLSENIQMALPITITEESADFLRTLRLPKDFKFTRESYRMIQIGHFQPVPCGGTHLTNLSELRSVFATKVLSKKGTTRISYTTS